MDRFLLEWTNWRKRKRFWSEFGPIPGICGKYLEHHRWVWCENTVSFLVNWVKMLVKKQIKTSRKKCYNLEFSIFLLKVIWIQSHSSKDPTSNQKVSKLKLYHRYENYWIQNPEQLLMTLKLAGQFRKMMSYSYHPIPMLWGFMITTSQIRWGPGRPKKVLHTHTSLITELSLNLDLLFCLPPFVE